MSIRLWLLKLYRFQLIGIRIQAHKIIDKRVFHPISKSVAFSNISISPSCVPGTHTEGLSDDTDIQLPDPPTTCCMSGCANCVWIEYAQELAVLYKDGGKAAEKVMKVIEDPSIKIFISLELREKLPSSEEEH